MSEDESMSTPLDNEVMRDPPGVTTETEKYSNDSESGSPVARAPQPGSVDSKPKTVSRTMQEIDRIVSRSVVKTPRTRNDQYVMAAGRKQDFFRFKATSRILTPLLERDFQKNTGGLDTRKLNIQAQALRMINANAVTSIQQFQRSATLPFMRKSLSLDYQKISLLKELSVGIRSVYKVLENKLEAIKINTAAIVPKSKTFVQGIFDDVKKAQRDRIVGNISKLLLEKQEDFYRKTIQSFTQRANDRMQDNTDAGGVNGVRRIASGELNSLRRKARDMGAADPKSLGMFGGLKARGGRIGSKLLSPIIRGVQKVKLGSEKNNAMRKFLSEYTDDAARFNPYASGWDTRFKEAGGDDEGSGSVGKLLNSFAEWRLEYRTDQRNALSVLMSIRDGIGGTTGRVRNKIIGRSANTPMPALESHSIVPPEGTGNPKSSIFQRIKSISFKRKAQATPVEPMDEDLLTPISSEDAPVEKKRFSSFRGRMKTSLTGMTGFLTIGRPWATKRESLVSSVDTPEAKPKLSKINLEALKESTSRLRSQANLDNESVRKMMDNLGKKVEGVTEAIREGDSRRTWFEKLQVKWKEKSELVSSKIRKNSYEDILARKEKRQEREETAAAEKVGIKAMLANAVESSKESLAGGDIGGAASDFLNNLQSDAVDELTNKATEKFEEKTGRAGRKLKIMRSARGRRLARAMRRGGTTRATKPAGLVRRLFTSKAATTVGTEVAEQAGKQVAKKGIGRSALGLLGRTAGGAASLGWGTTKIVGGLAGQGVKAVGKSALSGGWTLAKGLGPGLAVGLAADAANGWLDKNSSGTTKRLGKTAATAASWGATGAGIGSIVPVVGTAWGAGIGAAAGAVAANLDLISKGLSAATTKVFSGFSLLGKAAEYGWTSIFGREAKVDKWGRVKQQEVQSVFGNVKSAIFGRDAKYSKAGQIVLPGTMGLIPGLRKTFDLFFFGIRDPKDITKFKPESSIFSQMSKYLMEGMENFGSGLTDYLAKMGQGMGTTAGFGSDPSTPSFGGSSGDGSDVYKGSGTPVGDASAIVKSLIPNAIITSHRRRAGQAGKAGNDSWHVKSGAAVDVAPIPGMTFAQFKSTFTNAGYKLIEAIDETNPATMKKTGATGPHWHLVLGNGPGGSAYSMTPNAKKPTVYGNGSLMMQNGKTNSYAGGTGTPWAGVAAKGTTTFGNFTAATGRTPTPLAGGDKFAAAVNYLMSRKGYSKNAAIGIATNLKAESEFNTKAHNPKAGGRGAFGIAQWRGERISDIENHFGKRIPDMNLQEQLDAVDWEISTGKHTSTQREIPNGEAPLKQALNNARTPAEAIRQVVHRYERPSKTFQGREAVARHRIQMAMGSASQAESKPKQAAVTVSPAKQNKPVQTATKTTKAAPAKASTSTEKKAPSAPDSSQAFAGNFDKKMDQLISAVNGSSKKKEGNKTVVASVQGGGKSASPKSDTLTMMSMAKSIVRTGITA